MCTSAATNNRGETLRRGWEEKWCLPGLRPRAAIKANADLRDTVRFIQKFVRHFVEVHEAVGGSQTQGFFNAPEVKRE